MRMLLDTNIIIPLEDPAVVEEKFARLLSLSSGKHEVLTHPRSLSDLAHDESDERREITVSKMAKYKSLDHPPQPDEEFLAAVGEGSNPNDLVDNHLLYAVKAGAAQILVTNDRRINPKAERVG